MNVLVCFGTRPEAIKLAPICQELHKSDINYKICVTGQHKEMLQQVLEFFDITPDYDLEVMRPNQSLNRLSARVLQGIDEVLNKEMFNLVVVHGDTSTSSMVALAAFHRGIKVAHVEAGLRTYNKLSPFPEELNRQITGRIADLHFAPTINSKNNLLKEQVDDKAIYVTGNTVVDALLSAKTIIDKGYVNEDIKALCKSLNFNKKVILVTGHRRENFGQGIKILCSALKDLATNRDVEIVFPVHLNPNVDNVVRAELEQINNVHLIKPVSYPTFVWLMTKATLIISDSGGVQEEAPVFNVPVLVTRNNSERMEGVASGCSYLVGTNLSKILTKAEELLGQTVKNEMINPYGDGQAANRIVKVLLDYGK